MGQYSTEGALPWLFLKIADQLCQPLFGERVILASGRPTGLFHSPFQFFAVALFDHWRHWRAGKSRHGSIWCQQPKEHLQLNAPLACESRRVKFGGVIGICAVKSHADDLPCEYLSDLSRLVLSY
jgi:hypothetical protein